MNNDQNVEDKTEFINFMTFAKRPPLYSVTPSCNCDSDDCTEMPSDLNDFIINFKKRRILPSNPTKGVNEELKSHYDNVDLLTSNPSSSLSQERTLIHRSDTLTVYHYAIPIGSKPMLEYYGGRDRIVCYLTQKKNTSETKVDIKMIGKGVISTSSEIASRRSLTWILNPSIKYLLSDEGDAMHVVKPWFYKGNESDSGALGFINNTIADNHRDHGVVEIVVIKYMGDKDADDDEDGSTNDEAFKIVNLIRTLKINTCDQVDGDGFEFSTEQTSSTLLAGFVNRLMRESQIAR